MRRRTKFTAQQKKLLDASFNMKKSLDPILTASLTSMTGLPEPVLKNYWHNKKKKTRGMPTRKRTFISFRQKAVLEDGFQCSGILNKETMDWMVNNTGLKSKVIRNWWHNRQKKSKADTSAKGSVKVGKHVK